jgi:hypothetical protein
MTETGKPNHRLARCRAEPQKGGTMSRPERASPDYPQPEKNVAEHGKLIVVPTRKARQGMLVRPMLFVLTIGTLLAIALLSVAYFFYFDVI